MSNERRNAYRFGIDPDANTAVLKIGRTELTVHLLEKSSGGFGALVDPDADAGHQFQQGQTALLRTREGCCQVEISHVELHDGQVRLGMKHLGDVRSQSRFSGGSWGALAPRRLFSNAFYAAKVLAVFVVFAILATWGMSHSSRFWDVDEKPAAAHSPTRHSVARHSETRTEQPEGGDRPQGGQQPLIDQLLRLERLKLPRIAQRLELTEAQQRRIAEIVAQTAAALSRLYQAGGDEQHVAQQALQRVRQSHQQIEELLSDQQKQRWNELHDDASPSIDEQADAR